MQSRSTPIVPVSAVPVAGGSTERLPALYTELSIIGVLSAVMCTVDRHISLEVAISGVVETDSPPTCTGWSYGVKKEVRSTAHQSYCLAPCSCGGLTSPITFFGGIADGRIVTS